MILLLQFASAQPVDQARLKAISDQSPPVQLELTQREQATPEQLELAQFYAREIFPVHARLSRIWQAHAATRVMVDMALHESTREQNAWQDRLRDLQTEGEGILTSEEYRASVKRFRELAGDLRAPLATFARQLHKDTFDLGTERSDLPWVEEIEALRNEIARVSTKSPAAATMGPAKEQIAQTRLDLEDGKLTFTQAEARMRQLVAQDLPGHGQHLINAADEQLNRLAVVRTQLAQRKGYRTWAQYQLAQSSGYR